MSESVQLPFTEKLKAIPGFFGIRLEEKPAYEVIDSVGDVEIRRYAQSLLAEITLPGNHDEAVDAAFDRLARYIFGENAEHEQMSMTNPVYQREARQPSAAVPLRRRSNAWTIAFFLANDMLPVEAPKPNDPAIELVVEPEHVVAALRYTGNDSAAKRGRYREQLLATLRDHPHWVVDEEVFWAQYDAPFTLPFVKRNEAMVALAPRS
jgi:hypothetical protein